MAAAVSFRTLFIAHRRKSRSELTPQEQARKFFKEERVRRACRKESETLGELDRETTVLPGIPRAYMTSLRTYIDERDWAGDLGGAGPVVKLECMSDLESGPVQKTSIGAR